jgi:sec-independent protein translocase protein TatB
MFNFGITEIMVIAVIGLVVIGPERLPKVARTLGHMFSRMQRYVSDVKSDISKEMQLEELKAMQQSMKETASEIQESVSEQVNFIESEVDDVDKSVKKTVESELENSNAEPQPAPVKGKLQDNESEDLKSDAADSNESLDDPSGQVSMDWDRTKTGGIDLVGGLGFGAKSDAPLSNEETSAKESETPKESEKTEIAKNSEVT